VVTQVTSADNLVSRYSERPIVNWRGRHSKHLAKRSRRLDRTAVATVTGGDLVCNLLHIRESQFYGNALLCACVSVFWLPDSTINFNRTWQSRNFESIRNL